MLPTSSGEASAPSPIRAPAPPTPKSLLRSASKQELASPAEADGEDNGGRMGSRDGAFHLMNLRWPNGSSRWDPKERRGRCYHCGSNEQVRRNLCVSCRITAFVIGPADAVPAVATPKVLKTTSTSGRDSRQQPTFTAPINPYVEAGGYRYCQGNCSTIPRPLAEFGHGDSKKCNWCMNRQMLAMGRAPSKALSRPKGNASLPRTSSSSRLISSSGRTIRLAGGGVSSEEDDFIRPALTSRSKGTGMASSRTLKRAVSFTVKRKRSTDDSSAAGSFSSASATTVSDADWALGEDHLGYTERSLGFQENSQGFRRDSVVLPPTKRGPMPIQTTAPPACDFRRVIDMMYTVPEAPEEVDHLSFLHDSFGMNVSSSSSLPARSSPEPLHTSSSANRPCSTPPGLLFDSRAGAPFGGPSILKQGFRAPEVPKATTSPGLNFSFTLLSPSGSAFGASPPAALTSPLKATELDRALEGLLMQEGPDGGVCLDSSFPLYPGVNTSFNLDL